MNKRTLKVRRGHWDYTLKSTPSGGNRIAPFILLKGIWLELAGFAVDTPVSIRVEDGRLSIVRDCSR